MARKTNERARAKTRLALAQAAVGLFRERGYQATTVEDIAQAAGCSASTFFRHFATKEDVLFLNIDEIRETFRRFVSEPIPGLATWDLVHMGIVNSMFQLAEPGEEVEAFSVMSWLNEPTVGRRYYQLERDLIAVIAAALARERGVDADRDVLVQTEARAAISAYMAAFHVHNETGAPLPQLVDAAFAHIEAGIG